MEQHSGYGNEKEKLINQGFIAGDLFSMGGDKHEKISIQQTEQDVVDELEWFTSIAVGIRVYREIERQEGVHDKYEKCKKACLLIVPSLVDSLPVMKHSEIHIGHEQSPDDWADQVEQEVGGVFKEKCTKELLTIKNPCQWFIDDGDTGCYQGPIDEMFTECLYS